MKKLISLFLTLSLCISLCACDDGGTIRTENEDGSITIITDIERRIEWVYEQNGDYILVDKETGVMYLFIKFGYGGGLAVMVDEEGNPLIWEG